MPTWGMNTSCLPQALLIMQGVYNANKRYLHEPDTTMNFDDIIIFIYL